MAVSLKLVYTGEGEMIFRGASFRFEFPRPALIMGIVNVTPDSFSDGGQFFEPQRAIERALQLVQEGADIIDVGGESSRPGAEVISKSEELRRVLPVIEGLAGRTKAPISIDSQKPGVARAAIGAGASIINDVAANREGTEMWELAAKTGAGYVLMHMKGSPQTMHLAPKYDDVVSEVNVFFQERLARAESCGLRAEQIVLDPGIGFGKTVRHNLELLAGLNRFKIHQRPLLLGVSRKSFIGKLVGGEVHERVPGSIACSLWAVLNGAQLIRTHDVSATVQAVRMIEAIQRAGAEDDG
jgi:dihydropteroate synthase